MFEFERFLIAYGNLAAKNFALGMLTSEDAKDAEDAIKDGVPIEVFYAWIKKRMDDGSSETECLEEVEDFFKIKTEEFFFFDEHRKIVEFGFRRKTLNRRNNLHFEN